MDAASGQVGDLQLRAVGAGELSDEVKQLGLFVGGEGLQVDALDDDLRLARLWFLHRLELGQEFLKSLDELLGGALESELLDVDELQAGQLVADLGRDRPD